MEEGLPGRSSSDGEPSKGKPPFGKEAEVPVGGLLGNARVVPVKAP